MHIIVLGINTKIIRHPNAIPPKILARIRLSCIKNAVVNKLKIKAMNTLDEFIANKAMPNLPTKKFNSLAGMVTVATPEVLAMDLVTAPQHAVGINNMATILTELAETIAYDKLIELTHINTERFWIQRLGYLLELLGFEKLADVLFQTIKDQKAHWVRLLSHAPNTSIERNKKWHIIVNTTVEPDE